VGCGNGFNVLQEANKETGNNSRQTERRVFTVAATKDKNELRTAGSGTVNMITPYRTPPAVATYSTVV